MSLIARFAAYAAAFEKSFESDDWTLVEPFFAENAVYEVGIELIGGRTFAGRTAILKYMKDVVERFDRRFDSRELQLIEGPVEDGQAVRIKGSATYRAAGVPEFVLVLEEIVTFEGDSIVHLEDRYDDEMVEASRAYLAAHGEKLGISALL